MTDNIFEIEITDLAHVACAPQESGVLLTDFAVDPISFECVDFQRLSQIIANLTRQMTRFRDVQQAIIMATV